MKQTLFRGIKGVTSSRYRFYSHLSIRRELADEDETRKFGSRLASLCNKGDVVSLVGEMGSGKTIFCQGFIRKITGNDKLHVTSPTFLLDNQYLTQNNINVHHIDLYRLKDKRDMARLELFNSDDIYVIEWGNKLEDLKPQGGFLQITFDYYFDDNEPSSKRTITLESNDTTWIQRMHKLS